jgi:hypothetical protein
MQSEWPCACWALWQLTQLLAGLDSEWPWWQVRQSVWRVVVHAAIVEFSCLWHSAQAARKILKTWGLWQLEQFSWRPASALEAWAGTLLS